MTRTIDINVDAGESVGRSLRGADEERAPLVASINVASGASTCRVAPGSGW